MFTLLYRLFTGWRERLGRRSSLRHGRLVGRLVDVAAERGTYNTELQVSEVRWQVWAPGPLGGLVVDPHLDM